MCGFIENMQTNHEDVSSLRNEPIYIGKLIEEELRRQERSVSWFSRKINCNRRNVYDIFSRAFIDTGLLYRISLILNKDFFRYYSQALTDESTSITGNDSCAV